MFLIGCCALLGAAVALLLAATWLAGPASGLLASLHDLGAAAGRWLLTETSAPTAAADVAGAVLGAMLPGLVCLLLVEAAAATVTLRRTASTVLLLGAGASFAVVDPITGLLFGLAAVGASLLLWLATGPALTGPLAAAAGFLAATFAHGVVTGTDAFLTAQQTALDRHLELGAGWAAALSGLALVPVAACLVRLLRR